MAELWDIYDENRKKTGRFAQRGVTELECVKEFHIVVTGIILNSKNEILITQRAPQKYLGLQWECNGGSILAGQTSIEGMMDEIQEELGLTVKLEELELIFSGREDEWQVFFDLYYMKKDFELSDLVLQEEEVESVSWNTLEEIDELIKKDLFLVNHAEEVYRTIDILKQRK